jgi:hypothetical protein
MLNGQCIYTEQKVSPVFFLPEALGNVDEVRIAGHHGWILTPKLRAGIDRELPRNLLAPNAGSEDLIRSIRRSDPLFHWGYETRLDQRTASVFAFLFEFELSREDAALRTQVTQINNAIDLWFGQLRDWLEVSTHQDLSVDDPQAAATELGVRNWAVDGKSDWAIGNPLPMSFALAPGALTPVAKVSAVGIAQWQSAILGANQNKRPAPELLVLRDARHRFHRNQFAYSVIFAGMATEIALKGAIGAELDRLGNPEKFIAGTLNDAGLGALVSIAKSLGLAVPRDTQKLLGDPRNRATLDGEVISKIAAKKALDISHQIVEAWAPQTVS